MKAMYFASIFLLMPAQGFSADEALSKNCDNIATIAALAIQKKNDGVDFITFSQSIDEMEAPDSAKAAMKYLIAKAYSESGTPEGAYSSTFMECMIYMKD